MNSVLNIGQSAMSAASNRAAKAASNIVVASTERPSEVEQVGTKPPPARTPAVLAPDRTGTDQFLSGILELKLAEYAYAAGAAIVRTANEISKVTLRII